MSGFSALNLSDLAQGMPGLTEVRGRMMEEAASVCLEHNALQSGIELSITGAFREEPALSWQQTTPQIHSTYADLQEATEHGGYGVGILGTCKLSGTVVIDRSVKGTGFDFWLGADDDPDAAPFTGVKRLEISGILSGAEAEISARVSRKQHQVAPTNHLGGAYVAIVEFSSPELRVVQI